jgi:hypothetical protein
MSHVFLSCKHEDGDFADLVTGKLQAAGFAVWVDTDLQVGEDWRKEIDQGIMDAIALIVIMTPEAKASEYVTYEWAFALGAGKKVIPLVFKPTPLHPRLEALQYLDFTNRAARRWDALTSAVQRVGEAKKPHPTPTQSSNLTIIQQASAKLGSLERNERKLGIEFLRQMKHPAACEALIEALHHSLPDVRGWAAAALGQIGNAMAVPSLLVALRDEDGGVRRDAAVALGKIGDATAVPGLLETLRDEDRDVRWETAASLGKIANVTAVPSLLEALRDKDSAVRGWAVIALGQIGDAVAVAGLIELLYDITYSWHDEQRVCDVIATALKRIGTPEALAAFEEWRRKQQDGK